MKKMRSLIAALMLATATVPAMAGPDSVPVRNLTDQLIARVDGKPMTAEMVRKAIIVGASSKGWLLVPDGEGKLLASLNVRGKHHAKVSISYSNDRYSVTYLSAENLNVKIKSDKGRYDDEAEKAPVGTVLIHPNYNRWIANMQLAIQSSANLVEP